MENKSGGVEEKQERRKKIQHKGDINKQDKIMVENSKRRGRQIGR